MIGKDEMKFVSTRVGATSVGGQYPTFLYGFGDSPYFQTVILFSFWAPCDSTTLPDLFVIVHDLVALVKLAGYFGLIGVQPLVIIFHVLGMPTLDCRF